MTPTSRCDQRAGDAEVLSRSLRNENDLLRFQLNDLICREKNQRLELQRLRAHRDVEVSALVQASTQKLKGEVEQMKGILEPTSSHLVQALSDREKAISEKDQAVAEMQILRKKIEEEEATFGGRLRSVEEVLSKSTSMAASILESIEAFQKHVLPTFRAAPFDVNKARQMSSNEGSPAKVLDELQKLEAGIAVLRVIVDAKNDTLVLIRGKLKQENEELRAELMVARQQNTTMKQTATSTNGPSAATASTSSIEVDVDRKFLREEFRKLQDLYNTKVKQLNSKLKSYEQEESLHQTKFSEVHHDCQALQAQLTAVEASRHQLENNLKDETISRSQLVTQVFQFRKENERLKTELEMLKMNQKFLVRQPRKGCLPMEKMDLINTVNQLLLENNKLIGEKVALEEDVKIQRRSHVLERVKDSVTARDVALCVGDAELASKLARVRLQQLGQGSQESTQLALTDGLSRAVINPYLQPNTSIMTTRCSPHCVDVSTRSHFGQSPKMSLPDRGPMGLAQLAGLRERGIIGTN